MATEEQMIAHYTGLLSSRAALELVRAAKAMSDYWPSILPSKGVIPNNLIVDLRAAIAKAEGAQ